MVGTCPGLCPEFERVERIAQMMYEGPETVSPFGYTYAAEFILIDMPDNAFIMGKENPTRIQHGQKISQICCWL